MVSDVTGPRGGGVYTPETGHGASGVTQAYRPEQKNTVDATKDAEQVVLTDTAVKLHAIEQAVAKASPVDSERVAAVKKAVEEGSYQIDPERVADKLLQVEAQLPHKPDTGSKS